MAEKKQTLFYATFLCRRYNVKKMKNQIFAHENMKKPPQKVAYLSRNSIFSEIFHLLPNSPNGRIHVPKYEQLYIELGLEHHT